MRIALLPAVAPLLVFFAGCSFDASQDDLSETSLEDSLNEPSTGRVFGGPSNDDLFAPFQGEWRFENRTFDPEPEHVAISGGPDISIHGHIIRLGSGVLVREIRLCQTRATDDGIECDAWHHEDIHDPGDMQRFECKLRKRGDNLELRWRLLPSAPFFSDDPIIAGSGYAPPDQPSASDDLPWWIETYSPKPAN